MRSHSGRTCFANRPHSNYSFYPFPPPFTAPAPLVDMGVFLGLLDFVLPLVGVLGVVLGVLVLGVVVLVLGVLTSFYPVVVGAVVGLEVDS